MNPVHVPYVDFKTQFKQEKDELLASVHAVLSKGDFILGDAVENFERQFAEICNAKHAIAVANGTDSLILAMKALGIGPGDEVITAPNSWISSASSIGLIGARPVFADVKDDQNIDPDQVEAAITDRTKAIMPVHLTGRCADMERLLALGKKYGLPIIEDAAQAVTAKIGNHTAGSAGLVGSFSLHPLKNLNAAGDAGVLVTQDDDLAHRLRLLRHHGLKNRDEIDFWGYNSRLDTVQAAILCTRLPRLKGLIQKRRETAARYVAAFQDFFNCPIERDGEFHTYHTFVVQTDRREELRDFLQKRGVETKIHYPIPIHFQKAAAYLGYQKGSFPKTEAQASRILSLPIHQYLTQEQVDWVIESVSAFFR